MLRVGESRQRRLISNLHYIRYTDNGVRHSFKSGGRRFVSADVEVGAANSSRGSPPR